STGELYAYEISSELVQQQIESISPSEILIQKKDKDLFTSIINKLNLQIRLTKLEDWIFNFEYSKDLILVNFKTVTLKGFGLENFTAGLIASGVVLNYLKETQKAALSHLTKISAYNPSDYMILDQSTRRNLEITYSMQEGVKEGTLIDILDKTVTAMGGRLLKKWISSPLLKKASILKRLESVEDLLNKKRIRKNIYDLLKEIGDLERLISKVCTGRANPREVVNLKFSLKKIPAIKKELLGAEVQSLNQLGNELNSLDDLVHTIDETLIDSPPLGIIDGGVIRDGYSPELDELRDISMNGKNWISELQNKEREKLKISSLKISYNRVFGYYINISNTHKDKVPDYYIRKQTLVNSERFIIPELKEFEEKILHAEEKIYELETELFNELRLKVAAETEAIQSNAKLIAMLDCFVSFAHCAEDYNYIKPKLFEDGHIKIVEGRHPVVERLLPPGEKFTPNDYNLDIEDNQIILLTGPNMAGKSVYLRQIGLIVLLAQIGSFVPAKEAEISLVDRIFTRVGASDNIAAGESTFLVEMQESANILNNATSKSLILLDEVGRGTSTFDGISIAWAITEYIHENPDVSAKTLFATHYHELNEMAAIFPKIKNYKVEVREIDDKVIFLHKVNPGRADHSYGIQVAQMAGLPKFVTNRAKEILENLETKELTSYEIRKEKLSKLNREEQNQINMFEIKDDKLRNEIEDIQIDVLTPIEALNKLNELKRKVKDEKKK
ncbi:MAG: DNA mismatch repair protein MutS, partial [Bacteroidetes bacterium]|nr:DNA mismatch repair protein MutS [Bacteroidota bacterium]